MGVKAALSSAFFLGLSPVFGKLAILYGLPPTAVAALRTLLAALLLFLVMFLFRRPFLYIYPAGLLGCFLAGGINGLGSLLYYSALGRIDASLGQAIYSLYPLFVALWLWLDHQPLSRLTIGRLLMVVPALFLLTRSGHHQVDVIGMLLMLGASALYALHLPINQRVLYDMPAPTVTLYTLLSMSVVVVPSLLFTRFDPSVSTTAWWALGGMTLITFISRLTLFTGVKHLGGLQTALLGLAELLVTIVLSLLFLNEHFSLLQWLGVALLMVSLSLVKFEPSIPKRSQTGGWLSWLRPPGIPADIPWQPHN